MIFRTSKVLALVIFYLLITELGAFAVAFYSPPCSSERENESAAKDAFIACTEKVSAGEKDASSVLNKCKSPLDGYVNAEIELQKCIKAVRLGN